MLNNNVKYHTNPAFNTNQYYQNIEYFNLKMLNNSSQNFPKNRVDSHLYRRGCIHIESLVSFLFQLLLFI